MYDALNKVAAEYPDARIFGDIGCYTLGALPPFRAIDSCVDMGASITMAKGASDAGVFPAIAVIGDSTFTHSGMTGLLDAVNDRANITVVISDNDYCHDRWTGFCRYEQIRGDLPGIRGRTRTCACGGSITEEYGRNHPYHS